MEECEQATISPERRLGVGRLVETLLELEAIFRISPTSSEKSLWRTKAGKSAVLTWSKPSPGRLVGSVGLYSGTGLTSKLQKLVTFTLIHRNLSGPDWAGTERLTMTVELQIASSTET